MTEIPDAARIINSEYDTPAIRDGAVQYVDCAHCGAGAGFPCVLNSYQPWKGKAIPGFAHALRRTEYYNLQDVYGPATKTWELKVSSTGLLTSGRFVEKMPPCSEPRRHCGACSMCPCGVALADHVGWKSNKDVDDLLG